MSTADPFAHYDGAYVLGALSPQDRAAFEAHLVGCEPCRARVREVESIPSLLVGVAPDGLEGEPDGPPDTMLPALLRKARGQRRRRTALAALAGVAAAGLVAVAVAVWPHSEPTRPAPLAMTAVIDVPVTASARLFDRAWGTEIDLQCDYRGTAPLPPGYDYRLVVTDTRGATHDLGSWNLVPGKTISYTSGTSLTQAEIATIEITARDRPVLRLTL